jgi:hypothetical protein
VLAAAQLFPQIGITPERLQGSFSIKSAILGIKGFIAGKIWLFKRFVSIQFGIGPEMGRAICVALVPGGAKAAKFFAL